MSGVRCQVDSRLIGMIRASRVGLDPAALFGSELTAEGFVAGCSNRIQNIAIISVQRASHLLWDPASDTSLFNLKPDT